VGRIAERGSDDYTGEDVAAMHSSTRSGASSLGRRNSDRAVAVAACALGIAMAAAAHGEPLSYRVDPQATHVEYAASALGVFKQRGQFARVRGVVMLDRDAGHGQVDFTIDARSLATGWDLRDAFVQDEPLLDVARYPSIRFLSTRLVFSNTGLAHVEGELTLRGVTRAVDLNVTRFACGEAGEKCEADASATIRRSEFGMQRYAPLIDDDVELIFQIVARRAPEHNANDARRNDAGKTN
jgi:polyisoprenoid-binding protein YceI